MAYATTNPYTGETLKTFPRPVAAVSGLVPNVSCEEGTSTAVRALSPGPCSTVILADNVVDDTSCELEVAVTEENPDWS